tara:strand:+ start:276 stop:650 length:375 start_codon:yes stop_codon:yes gene_type:complete
MGMTSFYTGSLRYDHTGRKRKNHCANRVAKKRPPISTGNIKPSQAELDRLKAAKEFKEKYPSMMEQQIKNGTFSKGNSHMGKKEPMQYTGERKLVGIATMHKSNAVPIFEDDKEHAKDIARMRR